MANEKIMIVDDNGAFSQELQETLYLCGYDAKAVSDTAKALRLARRVRPDAILLDLRLSGTNGFQVAQTLKEAKETVAIPIIAMSGYFPIEDRSNLLGMHNMSGRIKKPFEIGELISEIELVLKR